jgi:hypothetical protein
MDLVVVVMAVSSSWDSLPKYITKVPTLDGTAFLGPVKHYQVIAPPIWWSLNLIC